MIFALAGTAAKAALTAGLPVGLLLYLSRARVAYAAAIVSVLVIITAPLTFARLERLPALAETADAVKLSAGHRLLIWSFAGDRIAERPLAGWGLDSSRTIPGGRDPIRPGETWMPLHPHNAPLQLWLELGVPGAVLFALLVALAWYALAAARLAAPVCRRGGGKPRDRADCLLRSLRDLAGMVARDLVVLAVRGPRHGACRGPVVASPARNATRAPRVDDYRAASRLHVR